MQDRRTAVSGQHLTSNYMTFTGAYDAYAIETLNVFEITPHLRRPPVLAEMFGALGNKGPLRG